jgi:hypothetical protein
MLEAEPRCVFLQSPVYVFGDIHGNLEDLNFFADNIWKVRSLAFTLELAMLSNEVVMSLLLVSSCRRQFTFFGGTFTATSSVFADNVWKVTRCAYMTRRVEVTVVKMQ